MPQRAFFSWVIFCLTLGLAFPVWAYLGEEPHDHDQTQITQQLKCVQWARLSLNYKLLYASGFIQGQSDEDLLRVHRLSGLAQSAAEKEGCATVEDEIDHQYEDMKATIERQLDR